MCQGKGGVLYSKFDLILPKKTKIKRMSPHNILLESDKMSINFNIVFDGCSVVLPRDFEKYYLGHNLDPMRIHNYRLELKIDVKFKIRSLFSSNGWDYHKWLDKYLTTINNRISMNNFFNSINWEQIRTLLYVMENKANQEIDEIIIDNQ